MKTKCFYITIVHYLKKSQNYLSISSHEQKIDCVFNLLMKNDLIIEHTKQYKFNNIV